MNKHIYGLDLNSDIRELYGDDYKRINNNRIRLFEDFNLNILDIKLLKGIIQNPIPISEDEFNEWVSIKNEMIKKYNYKLSDFDKECLNKIENFAYKHHVRSNANEYR